MSTSHFYKQEKKWTIFINDAKEKPENHFKKKESPKFIKFLGLASTFWTESINSHDSRSIHSPIYPLFSIYEALRASLDSKCASRSRVKICRPRAMRGNGLRRGEGNKVFLTSVVLCGLSSFHRQRKPMHTQLRLLLRGVGPDSLLPRAVLQLWVRRPGLPWCSALRQQANALQLLLTSSCRIEVSQDRPPWVIINALMVLILISFLILHTQDNILFYYSRKKWPCHTQEDNALLGVSSPNLLWFPVELYKTTKDCRHHR